VRSSGRVGGNILDVFSAGGEFLQSLYLEMDAPTIALRKSDLALLFSSQKKQIIGVYEIAKVN